MEKYKPMLPDPEDRQRALAGIVHGRLIDMLDDGLPDLRNWLPLVAEGKITHAEALEDIPRIIRHNVFITVIPTDWKE